MAKVLRLDGIDDRLIIDNGLNDSGVDLNGADYRIVIRNFRYVTLPVGSEFGGTLSHHGTSFANIFPAIRASSDSWHFRTGANQYNLTTIPKNTNRNDYEFKREGLLYTLTLGPDSEGMTGTNVLFKMDGVGVLAVDNPLASHHGHIEFGNIEIYDENDVLIHLFDVDNADDSNTGAQPVINDIIGGYTMTAVNMVTDGSAFIDLGTGAIELIPTEGDFNLSGQSIPINLEQTLTPTEGSLNYSGDAIGLSSIGVAIPTEGAFSLDGNIIPLIVTETMTPVNGELTITGDNITLTVDTPGEDLVLIPDEGLLELSGAPAPLETEVNLTPEEGVIYLTGDAVELSKLVVKELLPEAGQLSYTGGAITLNVENTLTPEKGEAVLDGSSIPLTWSGRDVTRMGAYEIGYAEDGIVISYRVDNI